MTKAANIVAPFLIAVALYNAHGLTEYVCDGPFVVENRMDGVMQHVTLDTSKVSPHGVQRFCIQVAFGQVFLWLGWVLGTFRAKAYAVTAAMWFALQALQVALGGNILSDDWMDWIVLGALIAGTELVVKYHGWSLRFKGRIT